MCNVTVMTWIAAFVMSSDTWNGILYIRGNAWLGYVCNIVISNLQVIIYNMKPCFFLLMSLQSQHVFFVVMAAVLHVEHVEKTFNDVW